jgi:hypothetical protein
VSECSLRGVVGQWDLEVLNVAEGPERVVLLQESGAEVGGLLVAAAGAVLEQLLDLGAQRGELLPQRCQVVAVLQAAAVRPDYLTRSPQQLSAELAGRAAALGELDQFA